MRERTDLEPCKNPTCTKKVNNKWGMCLEHRRLKSQRSCILCMTKFTPNNFGHYKCSYCRARAEK